MLNSMFPTLRHIWHSTCINIPSSLILRDFGHRMESSGEEVSEKVSARELWDISSHGSFSMRKLPGYLWWSMIHQIEITIGTNKRDDLCWPIAIAAIAFRRHSMPQKGLHVSRVLRKMGGGTRELSLQRRSQSISHMTEGLLWSLTHDLLKLTWEHLVFSFNYLWGLG